jgi:hypothetical protein
MRGNVLRLYRRSGCHWWAWGYHAAALRGEAPEKLSVEAVARWIETRPAWFEIKSVLSEIYGAAARRKCVDWRYQMAQEVVNYLTERGIAR